MRSFTIIRPLPAVLISPAWIGYRWAVEGSKHKGWCLRHRDAVAMALGNALACASRVDP